MFTQLTQAVKAYGTAFRMIGRHRLWPYFVYPVIIFILLLIGGTVLITQLSDHLRAIMIGYIGLPQNSGAGWSLLSGTVNFLLGIGLDILFFFAYSILIKNLILIL